MIFFMLKAMFEKANERIKHKILKILKKATIFTWNVLPFRNTKHIKLQAYSSKFLAPIWNPGFSAYFYFYFYKNLVVIVTKNI